MTDNSSTGGKLKWQAVTPTGEPDSAPTAQSSSVKDRSKQLAKDRANQDTVPNFTRITAYEMMKEQQEMRDNRTIYAEIMDKSRQNPLVPVGMIATVYALTRGLGKMVSGDSAGQQHYMRMRVGAQAFTVVALVGTMYYMSMQVTKRRKEIENSK